MGEHDLSGEFSRSLGKCCRQLAEDEMGGIGRTIGIAVGLAVKDIDVSFRQVAAQMIEASPEPQSQLEYDAGPVLDLLERPSEAGMLRLEAIEELFQSRDSGHDGARGLGEGQ